MKFISSKDNALYKALDKLASSARQRAKTGQTLLDGTHLLDAYLNSGKQPLQILLTPQANQNPEILSLLQRVGDVDKIQLEEPLFAGLSELKTLSGIMALVEIPQPEALPQNSNFCLLLENIQDPGNLGSILRSAAAAGCDAVYLSKECADAWSPKVLRAAMGGHFVLNIHQDVDLLEVVDVFPGKIYAASLSATASLYDKPLTGKSGFAIGNEGAGLSHALLEKTHAITIPMPGKVESLNAAAAAAVCLFEVVRQRRVKKQ